MFVVLSVPIWIVSNLITNGKSPFPKLQFSTQSKNFRPTTHEMGVINSIKGKLDQGLFDTSIRLLLSVDNYEDAIERIRGFKSSFASFISPENQKITTAKSIKFNVYKKIQLFLFKNRLLSFLNSSILSVSEVSGIYHFPYTSNTKTENIVKTYSNDVFLVHHESYSYLWLYYAIKLIVVTMIVSKHITMLSHIHPMVGVGRCRHRGDP